MAFLKTFPLGVSVFRSFVAIFLVAFAGLAQAQAPSRVLWVGNSYLYYNDSLHNWVRGMVAADDAALGARLQYKSATIGGAELAHHNIDWLTTPGRIGVAEAFELVVLQGNSADALSAKGQNGFQDAATAAAATVRSRGGEVAIYMVHAYVAPHRQANANNIRAIESFYGRMGELLKAKVLPVGLAFEESYRRHPEISLHQHYDGSHPNAAGTLLAAATAYATIYGKNPVGNAFDGYGKVDKATALKLQQVAHDMVQRYKATGPEANAAKSAKPAASGSSKP